MKVLENRHVSQQLKIANSKVIVFIKYKFKNIRPLPRYSYSIHLVFGCCQSTLRECQGTSFRNLGGVISACSANHLKSRKTIDVITFTHHDSTERTLPSFNRPAALSVTNVSLSVLLVEDIDKLSEKQNSLLAVIKYKIA